MRGDEVALSRVIRVLLADDHPVVRVGLVAMLGRRTAVSLVGQAADGAQAVAMARRLRPDVVLMDLRMPGLDGVAATARIVADLPEVRVLVLTTFDQDDQILAALRAGAGGYILKDAPVDDIVRAIEVVAAGQSYLHPIVAAKVIQNVISPASPKAPAHGAVDVTAETARAGTAGEVVLSAREREVLAWLAHGLSNREIGARLSIAPSTVKTHLNSIFTKLEVSDRTAAVAAAAKRGLLRLH